MLLSVLLVVYLEIFPLVINEYTALIKCDGSFQPNSTTLKDNSNNL